MASHFCTNKAHFKMELTYKNGNKRTFYSFIVNEKKGVADIKLINHFKDVFYKVHKMRLYKNNGKGFKTLGEHHPLIRGFENGVAMMQQEIDLFNKRTNQKSNNAIG